MPGFYISDFEITAELNSAKKDRCVLDEKVWNGLKIKRCTLDKFVNDKCLEETKDYIIVSEGVLLNKAHLFKEYGTDCVSGLIIKMFESVGETFFDKFRGSFSGALYIKKESKWIVYTNHYGDNMLSYSFIEGHFVISSQIDWILETLKQNDVGITFDENALNSVCSYGYMAQDFTYSKEIKRLYPGYYLVYKDGSFDIKKYFDIKPGKYDLSKKSEAEIIDEMDNLFREAVKLEYEKDKEYNYTHLTQLSGGLDSRMNLWVANELGYKDVVCMTFAQSDSLDEKIAKQITNDLGLKHIVWHLDSAKHLFKIDEYISMNYGLAIYGGIGAEKEMLDSEDISNTGLIHTGQIGDVIIGCFLSSEKELNDMTPGGLYSTMFKPAQTDMSAFYDREDYLMFVRGFMGCLSSHLYTRNYTEVASPFLNIELLEYCMSIPVSLRKKHDLYKKWILKKYPGAAKYIWEKTGKKITEKTNELKEKAILAIRNPKLVLKKLGLNVRIDNKVLTGMNPTDLWWENNAGLRKLYDDYYNDMILSDIISDTCRYKIKKMYTTGNATEKMLCITCLASIKYYFG